jgi:GNAT superfamily N-acetyltransferase
MDEPTTSWTVVELAPADTHALRLEVLRADTPTKQVDYPEDVTPGAFHLGVRDQDGRLIGTSSWHPRSAAHRDRPLEAFQLRQMATRHEYQGRGVGAAMIAVGIDRLRYDGATLVWANARDAALGFYRRLGFAVVGDGFIDQATQLPHHVVELTLL